jgi:hypothetical protein
MRRFLPHVFAGIGLLVLVFGCALLLSAPEQNPTPEMLAHESRKSLHFVECLFVGGILFLTGALWILGGWVRHRFSMGR